MLETTRRPGSDPVNGAIASQSGCSIRGEQVIYEDSEPALKQGPLAQQALGLSLEVFQSLVAEMV
jgi:hypothetical protein